VNVVGELVLEGLADDVVNGHEVVVPKEQLKAFLVIAHGDARDSNRERHGDHLEEGQPARLGGWKKERKNERKKRGNLKEQV